ncbi:hypothetical protein D3C78_1909260 [compost metagenome]
MQECVAQVRRTGITPAQGKAYLTKAFGKQGRTELTRGEMAQFIEHLKSLPSVGQEEGDA